MLQLLLDVVLPVEMTQAVLVSVFTRRTDRVPSRLDTQEALTPHIHVTHLRHLIAT